MKVRCSIFVFYPLIITLQTLVQPGHFREIVFNKLCRQSILTYPNMVESHCKYYNHLKFKKKLNQNISK